MRAIFYQQRQLSLRSSLPLTLLYGFTLRHSAVLMSLYPASPSTEIAYGATSLAVLA